jgi:hypothetical protein
VGPPVQRVGIAIEILTAGKFPRHRSTAHEFADERSPGSFRIVEAHAIGRRGAKQPVAVIEGVGNRVAARTAILVNLLTSEFKIVGRNGHGVFRAIRRGNAAETSGLHSTTPIQRPPIGSQIFKHPRASIFSHELMQHDV